MTKAKFKKALSPWSSYANMLSSTFLYPHFAFVPGREVQESVDLVIFKISKRQNRAKVKMTKSKLKKHNLDGLAMLKCSLY